MYRQLLPISFFVLLAVLTVGAIATSHTLWDAPALHRIAALG